MFLFWRRPLWVYAPIQVYYTTHTSKINTMRDSEGKELPSEKRDELIRTLKARFEKNMDRHRGIEWAGVEAKLSADDEKVWSLSEMERTGGEPDVVGMDVRIGEYIFFDCSGQSPRGRRNVCYDREGQEVRQKRG